MGCCDACIFGTRATVNGRQTRELRNWLMFSVALMLTVYEALIQAGERPFLLTLYASMMGLPLVLGGKAKPDNDGKG